MSNVQSISPASAQPVDALPPEPKVFMVTLHTGEVWKLNESPPHDKNLRVVKIVAYDDGMVEVFVYPVPGTEMDTIRAGGIFKFYPLSIHHSFTVARFDVLAKMMLDADAYEEDEDEEEEEEMTNGVPVATNGAVP